MLKYALKVFTISIFFYQCQTFISTNMPKKLFWLENSNLFRCRTKCQHCTEDNCETCWAWNAPSCMRRWDNPPIPSPQVSLVQLRRQTFQCLAWLQMRQSKARTRSSPCKTSCGPPAPRSYRPLLQLQNDFVVITQAWNEAIKCGFLLNWSPLALHQTPLTGINTVVF